MAIDVLTPMQDANDAQSGVVIPEIDHVRPCGMLAIAIPNGNGMSLPLALGKGGAGIPDCVDIPVGLIHSPATRAVIPYRPDVRDGGRRKGPAFHWSSNAVRPLAFMLSKAKGTGSPDASPAASAS